MESCHYRDMNLYTRFTFKHYLLVNLFDGLLVTRTYKNIYYGQLYEHTIKNICEVISMLAVRHGGPADR